MRGKPWTNEEEKKLRRLVKSDTSVSLIAHPMNKTVDAIVKKRRRLGLEVVDGEKISNPTTSCIDFQLSYWRLSRRCLEIRQGMSISMRFLISRLSTQCTAILDLACAAVGHENLQNRQKNPYLSLSR